MIADTSARKKNGFQPMNVLSLERMFLCHCQLFLASRLFMDCYWPCPIVLEDTQDRQFR